MRFFRLPTLLLLPLFLCSGVTKADVAYITFPSDVDWVTRETPHFTAVYRRGEDDLAFRCLKAAERAYQLISPIFPPGPQKTWMVLADFQDSTNGYSLDLPYPHIVIFVSPPEATGQLAPLDDWLDSVILHEYVHTLHIYPASGLWRAMRAVFGSWVIPNGLMPSHFHEGIAVLLETDKTQGGRGRGSDFAMYRRMAVDSKVWGTTDFFSRDQMDGSVSRWPFGTTAYFFGYELYRELWSRKGAQGIYELTSKFSSNWPFYINGPLEDVYGTDSKTLWADIFRKTTAESEKEIAKIKSEPLSAQKLLTTDKFLKWDLTLSPDASQVVFRRYNPTDGGALEIFDRKSGKRKRLSDMGGSAEGMCWVHPLDKDLLLFVEPFSVNGYSTNVLRWMPVSGGGGKKGFEDKEARIAHVHQLGCDPKANRLLVYQELAGKGAVRELIVDWNTKTPQLRVSREWKLPVGSWVTSLLIDGKTDWILLRKGLNTRLYRWNEGTAEPQKMGAAEGHIFNLKKGATPGELLAIANFEGRNEIWKLPTGLKDASKRVALLGGVNSFDDSGSTIIMSSYSHGGFDFAETQKQNLKTYPTPERYSEDSQATEEKPTISPQKEYSAWGTLKPTTWIPSILFVPNGVQFGVWIPGFDIAQKHLYNVIGGYDTRGLPFADVNYTYRFWQAASFDAEVFYLPSYIIDTQTFFQRWGGDFGISDQFAQWLPTLQLSMIYRRVESISGLPGKVSVGFQLTASKSWNVKRRPLSISNISGTTVSISQAQYLTAMGSSDGYFSTIASLDQYLEIPWWREHVLYAAARLGYTWGTVAYNNYFDAGGELIFSQQRGTFLNRGFLPQTFLARRIFNLNLEYRFPIATIERGVNYLPAKLRQLHFAAITDFTSVDSLVFNTAENQLFKIYYTSIGGELRSEWTFGSYLPTTLRIGIYHGFGPYGQNIYGVFGVESQL